VGVLVICILVFTVFCIVCTVFLLYYFVLCIFIRGPGVDSVSNRNEYQEHFLEVKAAGA